MAVLKKHGVMCLVICSYSLAMQGMLLKNKYQKMSIIKSRMHTDLPTIHNQVYGLKTEAMPQTLTGIFGEFKFDKKYGIRDYLGQYIAVDKQESLNCDVIEKAYREFLKHNSSHAINLALTNKVIDIGYAVKALYFTQRVTEEFEDFIESNLKFTNQQQDDPERYIWAHKHSFYTKRTQLLKDVQDEQKAVVALVDFLHQKAS